MGCPHKHPTSPRRRVVQRPGATVSPKTTTALFLGDRSQAEQKLLDRVTALEQVLLQGTTKLVMAQPSAVDDDTLNEESGNGKVVATKLDPQAGDEESFSDHDLQGMPGLMPLSETTKESTRVRRLIIVKNKSPPLTPSLGPTKGDGGKITRKIVKKKKKKVHAGTLDDFLDGLEKESMWKGAMAAPTTNEEEEFVGILQQAEYWKGKKLRADARIKYLERQKGQLQRRLEHLETGVLERLEHMVSAPGP